MRALALALTLVALPLTLTAAPASAGEPKDGEDPSLPTEAPVPAAETPAETPAPASAPVADEQEGDPSEQLAKAKSANASKPKSKGTSKPKSERSANDERCDHRSPIFWHEVEAGEHLGLIAGRYGVLSKDIVAVNPDLAANPNHIRVGQKLAICPEIPPREVVELRHVVAAGETFNQIAFAHDLSPAELLAQQDGKLSDPNKLRVGFELRIVTTGEIVDGFEPEPPQPGRLVHARKLPGHEAYLIKRPSNAYGTARTIKLIGQVVDRYRDRTKSGPKLRIGDISSKSGGPLAGHRSHQEGNDVDIGLILKGELADREHFSGASADNIDLQRTWVLVEEFLATGEIRYIFLDYSIQKLLYEYAKAQGVSERKLDEYFQYPRGMGRNHGIIRHWTGHKNHIHVRFR
ncbi:MAG: penicillin-insensitive murein endopeptidase [Myxococcales bacterium]|nr:penicillin-insensitive murein endopeptidase [Myxococcales bacterium]